MKIFLLTVALFAAIAYAAPNNKRDVSHVSIGSTNNLLSQANQESHALEPPKRSFQLPSTSYGVPFNTDAIPGPARPVDSYGNPVADQTLDPVIHKPSRRSFRLPSTSYGVPFEADTIPASAHPALVDSYGNPVVDQMPDPVIRAQRAPHVHDITAPLPHLAYGVPVAQAPQPVPHRTYGVSTIKAPQSVPHQTYGVPTTQAPQPVPHQSYGVPTVLQDVVTAQQQYDSNGGYVY